MKLHIYAVGTRMPAWVTSAWQDFAKRMPRECRVQLHEVKPEPRTQGKPAAQLMAAEARRIEAAIPAGVPRIILDERGQDVSTQGLAHYLEQWLSGGSDIALIIGGPDGLDASLKQTATRKLRLSSLTLPHPMVRVLLIEQLYRAWTIHTGHPYHRE